VLFDLSNVEAAHMDDLPARWRQTREMRARPGWPARMALLAGWAVRHRCPAATLPTNPQPTTQFVKINQLCEHQNTGHDEFLASPSGASEATSRR
jgi:hypothetical protein